MNNNIMQLESRFLFLLALLMNLQCLYAETAFPFVKVQNFDDKSEVERLIESSFRLPVQRRIEFISKYFIGRKYHPETKTRIKKQQTKKVEKVEATNAEPLPVEFLRTSMTYLDCMTYVEHVLALASSVNTSHKECSYQSEFLCRLIDIMFNADGNALMNHHRNHFTSRWADSNELKGYLKNIAREHPEAIRRDLVLNRVGKNRTFYIEDRFMISQTVQQLWFFPLSAVFDRKVPLVSGDVVAMVTDKEGLDVTHMGFFIEYHNKRWLRHASSKANRILDQDFDQYLRDGKKIKGILLLRPVLRAAAVHRYNFTN
ncbi:MAG: DUF1460 domain-containing protein [Candidatus Riflebacteria bacterium]|nr:DUF1460 domain-containing protein [Candidatus Riflebacteria bacterium]